MNIILLGSPASGKGTQADLLAKKMNLYHFQTGQLARELAAKDDRIKQIMNSGQLIPQEEMTMHAINYLDEHHGEMKDILFEGFPRFISQYEALKNFLKTKGDDIDAIISLEVSEEEAVKRISSRRICEKCGKIYNLLTNPPKNLEVCDACGGKLLLRDDDKPEAIKTRLQAYKNNTQELMNLLEKNNELIKVDGERPIEEIQKDLVEIVEKLKNSSQ